MTHRTLAPLAIALALAACDSGSVDDSTDGFLDDTSTTDDTGEPDPCLTTAPAAPTGVAPEGTEASPRQLPAVSWDAPSDGCATSYEVAVGTSGGADDVVAWTDVGDITSWDGVPPGDARVLETADLFVAVRAKGEAGTSEPAASSEAIRLWTPAQLSELRIWIDLADPTSTFTDGECTAAAASGDSVACVTGKGSAATVFLPDGTGPNPTATTLSDLPAIDFRNRGALGAPHTADLEWQSDELTFVVVDAVDDVDADGTSMTPNYVLNKEGSYEYAYWSGDLQPAIQVAGGPVWQWNDPGLDAAGTGLQAMSITYDGVGVIWRRNGAELGRKEAVHTGDVDALGLLREGRVIVRPTPVTLGGRLAGRTASYRADLGELLLLSRVLTDDEQAKLEAYLIEKWAVPTGE